MSDERMDSLAGEIHALRLSIGEMRDAILERIDTAYVRKDTHALEVQAMSNRLDRMALDVGELKASRNWVVAIVLAAVILAVLDLVITH